MSHPSSKVGALLASLLRERGMGLMEDRRRIFGFLRDRAPDEARSIRLLMAAFDDGVPARMKNAEISEIVIGREVSHLTSEAGIAPDLARDAVSAWAYALAGYQAAPAPSPAPPEQAPPQTTTPSPTAPDAQQSVRPLPSLAPVRPLPVQPLPPRSDPPPLAPAPAEAAATEGGKSKRLPYILIGVFLLGSAAKLIGAVSGPENAPAQQAPTAAPTAPEPAPAPSAPAPPAPAGPAAPETEQISILTAKEPFPFFRAERIQDNENSLSFQFGVPVGDGALLYQAVFAFAKNADHGQGLLAAFQGEQKAETGVIASDRIWAADQKKMYLRLLAPLKSNPINAPSLCIFINVAPTRERVDVDGSGSFGVFGLDAAGNCDNARVFGYGIVK
jgi:hypothetical protein